MTKKPGIKVEIFGSEYRIKGDADGEYVKRVAAYVDEKMKQVSQLTADSAVSKIAILAAINIADELLKERQQRQNSAIELSEKLRMIEDESR